MASPNSTPIRMIGRKLTTGPLWRHVEDVGQPAPLEDGDDQTERGAHREQEADGGLDGDDQ